MATSYFISTVAYPSDGGTITGSQLVPGGGSLPVVVTANPGWWIQGLETFGPHLSNPTWVLAAQDQTTYT